MLIIKKELKEMQKRVTDLEEQVQSLLKVANSHKYEYMRKDGNVVRKAK